MEPGKELYSKREEEPEELYGTQVSRDWDPIAFGLGTFGEKFKTNCQKVRTILFILPRILSDITKA